jgi:shikimate kinase
MSNRRTGVALCDTDEIIASNFGMSIAEIFAEHGEKKFREAETEVLRRIRSEAQTIIITGGGVVLREENVGILKSHAVIVWLDGDEETLFARASRKQNRPLLQTENPRKTFSQILAARRSSLRKHCGYPDRYLCVHRRRSRLGDSGET